MELREIQVKQAEFELANANHGHGHFARGRDQYLDAGNQIRNAAMELAAWAERLAAPSRLSQPLVQLP